MNLTTDEVIITILKVISATRKVIFASEEVIGTTLKIILATTKVILTTEEMSTAILKVIIHVQNKKYGNFVSISRLAGKCAAQKLKQTFAVYGHVYII